MFHNSLDLSHRYMHYSHNLNMKDSISYGTRTDAYLMTFDWSLYLNHEKIDISPFDTTTREHMTIVADFGKTNDKRGYDEALFMNISILIMSAKHTSISWHDSEDCRNQEKRNRIK